MAQKTSNQRLWVSSSSSSPSPSPSSSPPQVSSPGPKEANPAPVWSPTARHRRRRAWSIRRSLHQVPPVSRWISHRYILWIQIQKTINSCIWVYKQIYRRSKPKWSQKLVDVDQPIYLAYFICFCHIWETDNIKALRSDCVGKVTPLHGLRDFMARDEKKLPLKALDCGLTFKSFDPWSLGHVEVLFIDF